VEGEGEHSNYLAKLLGKTAHSKVPVLQSDIVRNAKPKPPRPLFEPKIGKRRLARVDIAGARQLA
jgi:hypothetical protein